MVPHVRTIWWPCVEHMGALQIFNDSKCHGRNISNYSRQNFEAHAQPAISRSRLLGGTRGNIGRAKGGSNLERLNSPKSFFFSTTKRVIAFYRNMDIFIAILFPHPLFLSKKNKGGNQWHSIACTMKFGFIC